MQQVLNSLEPQENGGFGLDGSDFVVQAPPGANLGLVEGFDANLVLEAPRSAPRRLPPRSPARMAF